MSYEDSPVDMEVSDGEEPGALLSDMDVSSSSDSSGSSICSNEGEYLTASAKYIPASRRIQPLSKASICEASLSHEDDDNSSQSSYHTAYDWFDPLDEGESGGEPGEIVDDPHVLTRQLQVAERRAHQAAEEIQRYERRKQELDEQIMRHEIRLSAIQKRAAERNRLNAKRQQQQQQQQNKQQKQQQQQQEEHRQQPVYRSKKERKAARNREKRRMQLMHRRQKRDERQRQREQVSFTNSKSAAQTPPAPYDRTVPDFLTRARCVPAAAAAPSPVTAMNESRVWSTASTEQGYPMRPAPARRSQPLRQDSQPTSYPTMPGSSHPPIANISSASQPLASLSASPAYRPPVSVLPPARPSSTSFASPAPPASRLPVRPALASRKQDTLTLEPQTHSQVKKPFPQTQTSPHLLQHNGQATQQEHIHQAKPAVKHCRKGHFTPHRLPFQVPDRMPEQAANASDTEGSLCLYEMVGGTCNDDTCKARHFRDFQGESSSPLAAASASPSSASPSTHVFGK